MATTTDYDAPRGHVIDLEEDSLEELKSRRTASQSGAVDVDETEAAEGFDLPGADLADEELTVTVVAIRGNAVRLGISAPDHVAVYREETWLRMSQQAPPAPAKE